MARFATSVRIDRSAPAVFRQYLDPANFPLWVDGYVGMETCAGEPARDRDGTKLR